jgi:hypothetical protein
LTSKEQLWYLIHGLHDGTYDIRSFCDEFVRIYDLELDYNNLSIYEYREMSELCQMASRFTDDKNELRIPNLYYSESQIKQKVDHIIRTISFNGQI